ncbi:hypothetical protein KKC13_01930 [bacterium]|nr:hypothetical protein [bacterium]MBU1957635.1 hypothetical protein [bacterium]
MNRIKIVGGLIFLVSILLALLSSFISSQNRINSEALSFINEQKAFTQEISKSIFYTYRNGENSSELLDKNIKEYLNTTKVNEDALTQNRQIATLWNIFYADVQKFRNQQKISTGYNSVITAKLVNRIYHNNVLLVKEFDRLIEVKQALYHQDIEGYRRVQYMLFFTLIGLLIYLFMQVRVVIEFIQKFSKTSKSIIENATIRGLKPLKEIEQRELKEATANYNHLVEKINASIHHSSQSIEQTTKALEGVDQNIEDFIELLSTMQEHQSNELFKKEDAVIDSLETLMQLKDRLVDLKGDLDKLVEQYPQP